MFSRAFLGTFVAVLVIAVASLCYLLHMQRVASIHAEAIVENATVERIELTSWQVDPRVRFADDNPAIDPNAFLQGAQDAMEHRESRRLSESAFMRLAKREGAIILDARSRRLFDLLHIKDAVNLPFPDISISTLEEMFPDKSTLILIYCNNNFTNAPEPFPSKSPFASLNLSTYATLYNYGYRNIFELGPLLDVNSTQIELVSSSTVSELQR